MSKIAFQKGSTWRTEQGTFPVLLPLGAVPTAGAGGWSYPVPGMGDGLKAWFVLWKA